MKVGILEDLLGYLLYSGEVYFQPVRSKSGVSPQNINNKLKPKINTDKCEQETGRV